MAGDPAPVRPRRIGVDAHILGGKPQGSRTWLLNALLRAIPMAPDVDWHLYARQRADIAPFGGFANVTFRPIPTGSAMLRLGAFWPVALMRDGCDRTLFQYHGPPMLHGRQVIVVHDTLYESHPHLFRPAMRLRLQALVRPAARRAAAVVAVSDWARGELIARYGLAPARVHLAPNGLDRGAEPASPRRSDGRTILFVGRIEPRKNLGLLLDAVARMQTPDRRLVVVGVPDGDDAAVARLRGCPAATHLERATDAQLAALLHSAAVLAFPSAAEGFGLPVLEALGAGLPVVASGLTAIPEVAGGFATLFDPHAPDAAACLARHLDAVIADPPRPDPVALDAHLARFDWALTARALLGALGVAPAAAA